MTNIAKGLIKATGVSQFRDNLKFFLDEVYAERKALIVTRPDDENVVVISDLYFNEMQKEINNLNYLLKLAKSDKQAEAGEVIEYDLDEMQKVETHYEDNLYH